MPSLFQRARGNVRIHNFNLIFNIIVAYILPQLAKRLCGFFVMVQCVLFISYPFLSFNSQKFATLESIVLINCFIILGFWAYINILDKSNNENNPSIYMRRSCIKLVKCINQPNSHTSTIYTEIIKFS
jgi:hypothetical protein